VAAFGPEAARQEALRDLTSQLEKLVLNLPDFGTLTLIARVTEYQITGIELGATISRKMTGRPGGR